jgi:hypothetical protein
MRFTKILSLFAVFAFGSVFANVFQSNVELVKRPKNDQKICAAKLAGIVYYPHTPAFAYLEYLKEQFNIVVQQALEDYKNNPIFGGAMADFIKKFNVEIVMTGSFGGSIGLSIVNGIYSKTLRLAGIWHAYAQSLLLGQGYGFDSDSQQYGVTFPIITDTAQVFIVTILVSALSFTPNPCSV